jgi:hypothetical protein
MHTHIDRVFTTVARNLGLKDFSRYTNNWIEWSYEAEKLIGSRDTFVQKEATYSATGAQATGTITFAANPISGDSITLNGVKLYFRNSTDLGEAKSPNEVEIGATLAATLDNSSAQYGLIQSLTGFKDVTASTGTYTDSAVYNYPEALNVADYSIDTTTGILTITAKEIGDKGNEYTLASDNANAKVNGLNLTGGKDIFRNQQLTLPENNVKLLGVRVGASSTQNKHYELRRASGPHRNRIGRNDNETTQKAFRYYVNGNRLNIQHDSVDEITISYLAYPVDLRGWPKIKEGHETAVAQYIMWQMKLIEFYNGKLPQYITKELEKRWYYLCGKARGDDGMPTSDELKQIGKLWNTLLPVNSSNGLINL